MTREGESERAEERLLSILGTIIIIFLVFFFSVLLGPVFFVCPSLILKKVRTKENAVSSKKFIPLLVFFVIMEKRRACGASITAFSSRVYL